VASLPIRITRRYSISCMRRTRKSVNGTVTLKILRAFDEKSERSAWKEAFSLVSGVNVGHHEARTNKRLGLTSSASEALLRKLEGSQRTTDSLAGVPHIQIRSAITVNGAGWASSCLFGCQAYGLCLSLGGSGRRAGRELRSPVSVTEISSLPNRSDWTLGNG
jgi:hypothetical protein